MADFAVSRANLTQARAALAAAQDAAYAAQRSRSALAAALQRLGRQLDPGESGRAARAGCPAGSAATGRRAAGRAPGRRSATASQQARAAAEGFASFTDPRERVGLLPDGSPFALFPVRLETRFVTEGHRGRPGIVPAPGAHLPRRLLHRHVRAHAVGH